MLFSIEGKNIGFYFDWSKSLVHAVQFVFQRNHDISSELLFVVLIEACSTGAARQALSLVQNICPVKGELSSFFFQEFP